MSEPSPMLYVPAVRCARCGKPAGTRRVMEAGGARYLEARCHGKSQRIEFASEPNTEVVAFAEEADARP